jgi:hypothetical protein
MSVQIMLASALPRVASRGSACFLAYRITVVVVPDELSGQLPRQPLDLGPAEEAIVVSGQEGPVEAGRDEPAPGVERGGVEAAVASETQRVRRPV